MATKIAHVNIKEIKPQMYLEVHVDGYRWWQIRFWIAVRLIKLATLIGDIEFVNGSD